MTTTVTTVTPTLRELRDRFNDMDYYFNHICTIDQARAYSEKCSDWLIAHPDRVRIDYDPFTPLSHQPGCIAPYFNLLAEYGVTPDAEMYLTTRSWFMNGTVSAALLLTVALYGRGTYVYPTAGNFPEDLCYILSAQ